MTFHSLFHTSLVSRKSDDDDPDNDQGRGGYNKWSAMTTLQAGLRSR